MAPPREPLPALSAPGLGAANSLLRPPLAGPRTSRRRRSRPFDHVRWEIDLRPGPPGLGGNPVLERIEAFLKERRITERGTLVLLAGATLHALSAVGFRRLDHWEVAPGGWLLPPRTGTAADGEGPLDHLEEALRGEAGSVVGAARTFSARLSDTGGRRVDLTVRWVHRERRHALSVDLWGRWTPAGVRDVEGALATRLSIARTTMTRFEYARAD